MSNHHIIRAHERAGLSRIEAAAYVGVSATLFDEMVKDRRMPQGKVINSRRVWSRKEVEAAFEELPGIDPTKMPVTK